MYYEQKSKTLYTSYEYIFIIGFEFIFKKERFKSEWR